MHTLGLILAGGGGRRFGGVDKAFLPLCGRTTMSLLIETLRPQTASLAISANGNPQRFSAFGLDVLSDGVHEGKGPLAGLAAGLEWAAAQDADALLTVPVDTPLVPPELVGRLERPPAVAFAANRTHHLVALWPLSCRFELAEFLRGPGPYRVGDFGAKIHMRAVHFPATSKYFLNINTPSDLAALARGMWDGAS